MKTKTENENLSRAAQIKLLKETVQSVYRALDPYHDLSSDLWRLSQTIKRQEKDHNKGRPSSVRAKPLNACVDYFIIKTVNDAIETVGTRKTIPIQAVNVRSDYLLALKLVANIKNREQWGADTILSSDLKRQIKRCAAVTDYCDL